MNVNHEAVAACLEQSDNFYMYDEAIILQNMEQLKTTFPQVDFLYSVKCNANEQVLKSIFSHGFGADAASAGEVRLAQSHGLKAGDIYFSAPGKTVRDIENTWEHAILIADSISEIHRIQEVAERNNTVAEIGIRINPEFTFAGEGGAPSKFGIDEAEAISFLQTKPCPNVKVVGIHVHVKSQELRAAVLATYYQRVFDLVAKLEEFYGDFSFVNFGSGIGVAYGEQDTPLDFDQLAKVFNPLAAAHKTAHPHTKLIIEVGRYVVCKSGVYVTTVLDRKVSHGKIYLILKNTMNGFIRPSVVKMVEGYVNTGAPASSEPLFTSLDAFQILTLQDAPAKEPVTLVGNLCTAADVIAEDIMMPHLECGDAVILTNAGSYAFVLSPTQFSSQDPPREFFVPAGTKDH